MSVAALRAWNKNAFWISIALVILAYTLVYIRAKAIDRPLAIQDPVSADAKPDYDNAKGLDYKKLLDLRQNVDFIADDNNGWRSILLALGPRALEQKTIADKIPWQNVPTDLSSKSWFETFWSPICEKFAIDPKTKPTFYDRMPLYEYLLKFGNGKEGTKKDENFYTTYFENYEEKEAVIDHEAAGEYYAKLIEGAWNADDYPAAASWLAENADLYEVLSQAVRKPQFRMWRISNGEPLGMIAILLPDVPFLRTVAHYFAVRANYRIGTGNFDDAIDDIESILRLYKHMVQNKNAFIIEHLVACAVLNVASSIGLDGNSDPDVRPSAENCKRLNALWLDILNNVDRDAVYNNGMQIEHEFLLASVCQYSLVIRREGGLFKVARILESENFSDSGGKWERIGDFFAKRFLLVRGPFDDALCMQTVDRFWNDMLESFQKGEEYDYKIAADKLKNNDRDEIKVANMLFTMLCPAYASFKEAENRNECLTRLSVIDSAILRYATEHGTLPPTFSVDAEGNKLHSWRVLILPYLGEEAEALYQKIDLEAPWNSEKNKPFHKEMPKVFSCPSNTKALPGQTTFSVVLGEDALFDESGVGKNYGKMRRCDGADGRELPLVVERTKPVNWMDPNVELAAEVCNQTVFTRSVAPDSDIEAPMEDLAGASHPGGMNVGLVNGAVLFQNAHEWKLRTSGETASEKVTEDDSADQIVGNVSTDGTVVQPSENADLVE